MTDHLLLPATYRINAHGHMEIGGCDLMDLAAEYCTPLYVYDEETVRQQAGAYLTAMGDAGRVLYSAKAFFSPQFLRLVGELGMGLSVASGGELHVGLHSGMTAEWMVFGGNNKSAAEVEYAYRSCCILSLENLNDLGLVRKVPHPRSHPDRARHHAGHSSVPRDGTARLEVWLRAGFRECAGGGGRSDGK